MRSVSIGQYDQGRVPISGYRFSPCRGVIVCGRCGDGNRWCVGDFDPAKLDV